MRYFLLIWIFILPFFGHAGFSEKIDALIQSELPHAVVGVFIQELGTGRVLYKKNADKLLAPASGIKLFTAAAALYQLKANYRFSTSLAEKNENIYIIFRGSPSLTVGGLNHLLLHLNNKGIKTIQGNLILDDSRFTPPYYAAGNSYDDLGWYYTAPSTAITINGNAVVYEFVDAEKPGRPVKIKPKIPDLTLPIINEVVSVTKNEKQHCDLNIDVKSNNTLKLYGCLVKNKEPRVMQLAITNPLLFAKNVIKKTLDKNHIVLKGSILSGKTPADARIIAGVHSKQLSQLVIRMLQESDNLYAGNLFKEVAHSITGEGTYKQGVFAVKKILAEHTTMDIKQLELSDGVGTRYNLATPEQIVLLLTTLYHDKRLQPIFMNALPQSGVSGTLKNRMKKTILEKRVFAKTGTMHDLSSLSGYMIGPSHQVIVFSIIINGINTPLTKAKSLEDRILLMLSGRDN